MKIRQRGRENFYSIAQLTTRMCYIVVSTLINNDVRHRGQFVEESFGYTTLVDNILTILMTLIVVGKSTDDF